ncbi:MAG TPA: antibiotic biosynthesis monooxygenase [Xanthobacteraceae bacterium]|jgi:quinol monooxygenase YgiN|nr:antibiotic biosynthesis monooxygenase [Xanthobacteraceae bacterium]
MASTLRLLLGVAFLASMTMTTQGQPAPPAPPPVPDGVRYVVTYFDVMQSQKDEGAALVRQFRDASRKDAGNLRVEAARRMGVPNQFVVLEAWKDQPSFDAHAQAAHTTQFRDKLKTIQNAPYDERVHFPLSVGPLPASLGGAAVIAVTHVDVIPPQRENATTFVKQLADDGRKDDGNLRFEAVTQTNRQNHFTVVEAWRNRKAADAHSMNAKTRTFRDKLAPASGALYDQRFYKLLD